LELYGKFKIKYRTDRVNNNKQNFREK